MDSFEYDKIQNTKYKMKRVISMCIPRVHMTVTRAQILQVFYKLNFGKIDRVDIVLKKSLKGEEYKRVFLHYTEWNTHERAEFVKERLTSGKDIKVVYDFPWYWKISLNKSDK